MKTYTILIARYNKQANKKLLDILKKMKPEDFEKDTKAYFGSIRGIFEHILVSDMKTYNIIKTFSRKNKFENEEILKYYKHYKLVKEANKDLKTLFETREKMDNLIIQIIDSIDDFNKCEEIAKSIGHLYSKKRIQMVLNNLVHSTHHRGQISALLDQLGYKNDYSSLMHLDI